MAGTHRSTVVLDKVLTAFFNSDDYFLEMTTRANKHLLVQFMLALEIKFERALHFHDEGNISSDDNCLPNPLIRSTHIYWVPSASETSFNLIYYQKQIKPTFLSTPKQTSVKFHFIMFFIEYHSTCLHANGQFCKIDDTPLPTADSNSDTEEEDFPWWSSMVWRTHTRQKVMHSYGSG